MTDRLPSKELWILTDEKIESLFADEPRAENFDTLLDDFYDRLRGVAKEQARHIAERLKPYIPHSYTVEGDESYCYVRLPVKVWQSLEREIEERGR